MRAVETAKALEWQWWTKAVVTTAAVIGFVIALGAGQFGWAVAAVTAWVLIFGGLSLWWPRNREHDEAVGDDLDDV